MTLPTRWWPAAIETARTSLAAGRKAVVCAQARHADHRPRGGLDDGGFEDDLFSAPVPGCDFSAHRVGWGKALEGNARSLMEVEEPDTTSGAREEAKEFLLEQPHGGPVPTKELQSAARAYSHSWATVRRAQQEMGIVVRKVPNGPWTWELPPDRVFNTHDSEM
jgi:hypothetical protein